MWHWTFKAVIGALFGLAFLCLGIPRVWNNTRLLVQWTLTGHCEIITPWPWAGAPFTKKTVRVSRITRTLLIISDITPAAIVTTSQGEIPPYVRRTAELDRSLSEEAGIQARSFESVKNPVLHLVGQIAGTLVICGLGFMVLFSSIIESRDF